MTSCRTLGDGGSCRGSEAKIHEDRWASIAVQAAADVLRPCTVHRPIYFLPSTRPSTSTTTSSWRVKAHWLVASCTNANIVWFPCIYLLASISLESCLLAIAWVLYVIIFLRWACWFDLVNWKFRTSGFDFVFTWSSQKRMILQVFFERSCNFCWHTCVLKFLIGWLPIYPWFRGPNGVGDGFCPDMQLGVRVRIEVRGSRVRPVAILLPMILFSIVRGSGVEGALCIWWNIFISKFKHFF